MLRLTLWLRDQDREVREVVPYAFASKVLGIPRRLMELLMSFRQHKWYWEKLGVLERTGKNGNRCNHVRKHTNWADARSGQLPSRIVIRYGYKRLISCKLSKLAMYFVPFVFCIPASYIPIQSPWPTLYALSPKASPSFSHHQPKNRSKQLPKPSTALSKRMHACIVKRPKRVMWTSRAPLKTNTAASFVKFQS